MDQQDHDTKATADVNDDTVQATEETADQMTLTDVSNTTGTLSADAQTEFALEDVGLQHGPYTAILLKQEQRQCRTQQRPRQRRCTTSLNSL